MTDTNGIRLQKFLSAAGVCSRRAAEELIVSGEVTVNGRPAELGQRVDPARDRVAVGGRKVSAVPSSQVTLAMNKPKGFLCSHRDPHHDRTVFDLLPRELEDRRFLIAGRLDLDSEGLLILTTDGDLANRLMHPSSGIVKRYYVTLNRPFPIKMVRLLIKGVQADGERLKAEKAIPLKAPRAEDSADWEVHLQHGRKREIRRLFEALGYRVKRLKRFQIGNLTVRRIPSGKVKILSDRDLRLLFQSGEGGSGGRFF